MHPEEIKPLIQSSDVRLIARKPVEAFGDQHLHVASRRLFHKTLQARAVDDRCA
jgi:hypothetical protein